MAVKWRAESWDSLLRTIFLRFLFTFEVPCALYSTWLYVRDDGYVKFHL